MPFDKPLLNGLRYIDNGLAFFSKPEFLFAVKAGLLTVAVAAPAYVPNTAGWVRALSPQYHFLVELTTSPERAIIGSGTITG